ncbi:MAG: hypothetical protein CMP86_15575 [Gammaproteobacteria bacterium]|nr:hypothetical protein [Gammaproteobacteria bacterium]
MTEGTGRFKTVPVTLGLFVTYNSMMELKPQRHLQYIVDFDAFSIIFRPKTSTTDCIQYRRKDYTPENVEFLINEIREKLPLEKDNSVPSIFVLQYFLRTDNLVSLRGLDSTGNKHYWLMDRVTGTKLDPSANRYPPHELTKIYGSGKIAGYHGSQGKPAARFFDLMEQVDPIASRFEVEELITVKNKDASTLFKEKWSMSYLAQNGVFG